MCGYSVLCYIITAYMTMKKPLCIDVDIKAVIESLLDMGKAGE